MTQVDQNTNQLDQSANGVASDGVGNLYIVGHTATPLLDQPRIGGIDAFVVNMDGGPPTAPAVPHTTACPTAPAAPDQQLLQPTQRTYGHRRPHLELPFSLLGEGAVLPLTVQGVSAGAGSIGVGWILFGLLLPGLLLVKWTRR